MKQGLETINQMPQAKDETKFRHYDDWKIVESTSAIYDAVSETVFALSNGFLGIRGGVNEISSPTDKVYISSIFENSEIDYHERFPGFARKTDTRIPVADPRRFIIELNGRNISGANMVSTIRTLNMKSGEYVRTTIWNDKNGGEIVITSSHIAPFKNNNCILNKFKIESRSFEGIISVQSIIDDIVEAAQKGDDPRLGVGVNTLSTIVNSGDDDGLFLVQETHESKQKIAIYVCQSKFEEERHFSKGEVIEIEKYSAFAIGDNDDDNNELIASAKADAQKIQDKGYDLHLSEQAEVLAQIWKNSQINLDVSDNEHDFLNPVLRFNIFHLIQSAGLHPKNSIAAKGLSGEGYEGHVFWDTETFVLPFFVYTNPKVACELLLFRFRGLEKARLHARELNHEKGALYPWRTINGDECSGYFPAGSAQYHINGDIAHAITLYHDISGDNEFMVKYGAEMLFETARIWLEIGFFNQRKNGDFCINCVTGPDEYTALVNNNYFTNLMAQRHLHKAVELYDLLQNHAPQEIATLKQKIALSDEEVLLWKEAALKMHLPYDEKLGIRAQDDNFLERAVFNFGEIGDKRPLLLHYHPLSLYRYQICKQADLVLADIFDDANGNFEVMHRDFKYYDSVSINDSTLSASCYGTQALRLGLLDEGFEYFRQNIYVDIDNLHENTDHGCHMAALAGSWHNIAFGYCGIEFKDGDLHFVPRIAKEFNSYELNIVFRNAPIKIRVDQTKAYFLQTGDYDIAVKIFGRDIILSPNNEYSIGIGFYAPISAVIFDLDGVITDTAIAHFKAWKKIAKKLSIPFDEKDNEELKGVDRIGSLELILNKSSLIFSDAEKYKLCEIKNNFYLEEIKEFNGNNILPGALDALKYCRENGIKTALASASRNAAMIIEKLGLDEYFDFIADPSKSINPKPAPDVFLAACDGLLVNPINTIGIEDSAAGISAIKAAGMRAVAIGNNKLLGADIQINQITKFTESLSSFGSPSHGITGHYNGGPYENKEKYYWQKQN